MESIAVILGSTGKEAWEDKGVVFWLANEVTVALLRRINRIETENIFCIATMMTVSL
jgi:hypothetical protein